LRNALLPFWIKRFPSMVKELLTAKAKNILFNRKKSCF
jgi:hypothetical protein